MLNYSNILNKLFHLNVSQGMKLGLSNVQKLNQLLENPDKHFKAIHIAGTNGKGSVTAKIAKGLEFSGYKVGLYISPHISTFRERISINGKLISEESVCKHALRLFDLMERKNINATFFELTTLIAFLHFAENNVNYAVLETGLGGRLDATNIVHPELAVITSISLDHTEILGATLEEIAQEKAGIVKNGVPVILGPRTHFLPEMLTNYTQVKGEFSTFEEENCAIAKACLEHLRIDEHFIDEGINFSLPCRMEKINDSPLIIMDVAHNPDGLNQLFRSLKMKYGDRKIRLVFGLSKNKDKEGCMALIKKHANFFHLVESSNGRGLCVNELYTSLLNAGVSSEEIFRNSNISNSIQDAINMCKHNELLLICGTFFIMREARQCLGIQEPFDLIDMNERKI